MTTLQSRHFLPLNINHLAVSKLWISYSNRTSWIIFPLLISTCSNTPPQKQPVHFLIPVLCLDYHPASLYTNIFPADIQLYCLNPSRANKTQSVWSLCLHICIWHSVTLCVGNWDVFASWLILDRHGLSVFWCWPLSDQNHTAGTKSLFQMQILRYYITACQWLHSYLCACQPTITLDSIHPPYLSTL